MELEGKEFISPITITKNTITSKRVHQPNENNFERKDPIKNTHPNTPPFQFLFMDFLPSCLIHQGDSSFDEVFDGVIAEVILMKLLLKLFMKLLMKLF